MLKTEKQENSHILSATSITKGSSKSRTLFQSTIMDFLRASREERLFALAIIKQCIGIAERLYKVTEDQRLFEYITNLYLTIEKYDLNKRYS